MNRRHLIEKGIKLKKISDFSELCEEYEDWKTEILQYYKEDKFCLEQCRLLLHVVDTPYESKEEKRKKYIDCIKKTVKFLEKETEKVQEIPVLESVIGNFGLYLKNMFRTEPENKATLQKTILGQIEIQNEYDLQHIMYAVIKALYPSARREVNQDTGYKLLEKT